MWKPLVPVLLLSILPAAASAQPRLLALDDYLAIRSVADVEVSPDARWAAYVVRDVDVEKDTRRGAIWRVPLAGGAPARLTATDQSASHPRWSPDGRYLAFLSDRSQPSQVWLLPLDGGEAFRATDMKGGVNAFAWAPDSRQLVVVSEDPDPNADDTPRAAGAPEPAPPPIVVTRLQHKRDGEGYLTNRRAHLYIVTLDEALTSGGARHDDGRKVTTGPYDASSPSWSPDGTRIAFASNRSEPDPDANNNSDIWVIDVASETLTQVTTDPGSDRSPVWAPDGRSIAYVHEPVEPAVYATPRAMTIAATGGTPRDWTGRFDRHVAGPPVWAADGRSLYVVLVDEGRQPLVRVTEAGSREPVIDGDVNDVALAGDRVAVVMAAPDRPADVYAAPLAGTGARVLENLSRANETLFASVRFTAAESVRFKSADGTPVHGFVIKPPDFDPSRTYPLVLRIHGGPVAQYTDSFTFDHQYLASLGMVVLITNPRGSNGYGEDFCKAIFADWGNKDTQDVLAGVDHLIAQGYIDDKRLGLGGWSYGGILTNYVITKTTRFAAAISGASETDMFSAFGTDDLVRWWLDELGPPWKNVDLYRKLSPIYDVEKITTPTLLLVGDQDYRVPLPQSEQMYLQLRALGRETGLIIYPGQSHSIRRPSYEIDRLRRYGLWYEKYLLGRDTDALFTGR